jgi:hypothetical protein
MPSIILAVRAAVGVLVSAAFLPAQITVHLSAATNRAFDDYIKAAEAKMDRKPHTTAKRNEVDISAWEGKSPRDVEDGLIHDWVAGTLIRGAKPEKALAVFQNYANYKKIFAPEVVDSKILDHEGPQWRTFLRLRRKSVVTVVFDTEHNVEYKTLDTGGFEIRSRSSRISEVDDAKDLPAGTGQGFLWRLNSYWLIEPRTDGLYVECRAISLSRDIPTGLGWIVRPMISSVPRDSLQSTMDAVRRALQ